MQTRTFRFHEDLVFLEIGNRYHKSVYIHGPGNLILRIGCMEQPLEKTNSVQTKSLAALLIK